MRQVHTPHWLRLVLRHAGVPGGDLDGVLLLGGCYTASGACPGAYRRCWAQRLRESRDGRADYQDDADLAVRADGSHTHPPPLTSWTATCPGRSAEV